MTPRFAISRPASGPVRSCEPKSTTLWVTRRCAERDIPGAIRWYDECVASTARRGPLGCPPRCRDQSSIRQRTAAIASSARRYELRRPVEITEFRPAEASRQTRQRRRPNVGRPARERCRKRRHDSRGPGGWRPARCRPKAARRSWRWTLGASRSENRCPRRPPRCRARKYPRGQEPASARRRAACVRERRS